MIHSAYNSEVVEDIEEHIEELLEYQKLMQQSHVGGGESCWLCLFLAFWV